MQTDTGPAALEANYSANRINTTWYSDGTAIQGAPSYCMYDSAITLPAAQTKPGYTFGGWRLHVAAAPEPVVPTLSTISNETVTAYGYYTTDCGGECGATIETLVYNTNGGYWDNAYNNPYHLMMMGDFGITFGTNVVKGEGWCSYSDSSYSDYGNMGQYCWCRVTSFTPDNGTEQSFSSSSWVLYGDMYSFYDCGMGCAVNCVTEVKDNSSFRSSVFDAAQ